MDPGPGIRGLVGDTAMTRLDLASITVIPAAAFVFGLATANHVLQSRVNGAVDEAHASVDLALAALERLKNSDEARAIIVPDTYRAAGRYYCSWDGPLE